MPAIVTQLSYRVIKSVYVLKCYGDAKLELHTRKDTIRTTWAPQHTQIDQSKLYEYEMHAYKTVVVSNMLLP